MSSIVSEEEFDELVGEAARSINLERILRYAGVNHSVYFLDLAHYTTITFLDNDGIIHDVEWKNFPENNIYNFIDTESRDYYTCGFVPLDDETDRLLRSIRPKLKISIRGVAFQPLCRSFCLYTRDF